MRSPRTSDVDHAPSAMDSYGDCDGDRRGRSKRNGREWLRDLTGPRATLMAGCLLGIWCLTGCSALWEDRPDARVVSLAEFSQPIPAGTIVGASPHLHQGAQASETEAATDHEGVVTPPPTPGEGDAIAGSSAPSGSAASGSTTQQKPAVAKPPTSAPSNTLTPEGIRGGDVWIVDALVGQINGRPVFAQEFLEPIEAKLIELASRTSSTANSSSARPRAN